MFVLAIIEDNIKTAPDQFDRDPTEVLIEQIDLKYTNKILIEVGLCVSFYDFIKIGDPYVYPGEGASHQVVNFRMVIFRPFAGEVMLGRILSSSIDGLRVTTEFFDDIFIPSSLLQTNSEFDRGKKEWKWNYDEGGDSFPMELGGEIRFKVKTISFTTVTNTVKETRTSVYSETRTNATVSAHPHQQAGGGGGGGGGKKASSYADHPLPEELGGTRRRSSSSVGLHASSSSSSSSSSSASSSSSSSFSFSGHEFGTQSEPAMKILATVREDGLGIVSWWR